MSQLDTRVELTVCRVDRNPPERPMHCATRAPTAVVIIVRFIANSIEHRLFNNTGQIPLTTAMPRSPIKNLAALRQNVVSIFTLSFHYHK